ncbi:MAG: hypothetical protein LBG42_02490, partial [Treponema sp.]|jgi:hypothetical protein|nr:hypothetical protein [Treponema sp.]
MWCESRYDTTQTKSGPSVPGFRVYRNLCPLVNYCYPAIKAAGKRQLENGWYKKEYEKHPKTPCQRLLELPDVGEGSKAGLWKRSSFLNPVELKKEQDEMDRRLLQVNCQKVDSKTGAPPGACGWNLVLNFGPFSPGKIMAQCGD